MKTQKLFLRPELLLPIVLCVFIFGTAKTPYFSIPETATAEDVLHEVKAEDIVKKMVKAHGGLEKWLNAPTVSFTHTSYLFLPPDEEGRTYYDNWRHFQVTVEPQTSRGYVLLPLENFARIAVAHGTLWSQGYDRKKKYKSSPLVVMYYQYSFINLPWLTQMPGVNLEYMGVKSLPQDTKSYHTVKMTFAPESGREHPGYYILFIDPETFLLKGTRHTAILPILPGGATDLDIPVFPQPYYRLFDSHINTSGLIVPASYQSYSTDGKVLLSIHLITNPSFEEPFNEIILQDLQSTIVQN